MVAIEVSILWRIILLGLGIILLSIIVAFLWGARLVTTQVNIVAAGIAVAALVGLLYYAYHTKNIAEATKENTEITKRALAGFTPAFSFGKEKIQSYRGEFITYAPSKEFYIFKFYIHNTKDVPGRIKIDFYFYYKTGVGSDLNSELRVFTNKKFDKEHHPEEERLFYLQPYEIVPIHAVISTADFVKWIDIAYPDIEDEIEAKEPNIAHRVGLIMKRTKTEGGLTEAANLSIKMLIYAKSEYSESDNWDYKCAKEFNVCFESTNTSGWKLRGERFYYEKEEEE